MKNVNKIREYKNRYWLVNDDVYELHFHQFYDRSEERRVGKECL